VFYALVRGIVLVVARLVFRLEGRGREHVPRTGAALIISNHTSFLDPPLVGAAAPRELHYLAKAELFSIPLLGWLVARLNSHPVKREGSDPAAIRTALRLLEAGHAVLVFPEGTRGEEGTLREAKTGAGMLAVLSRAPVVPAYVQGSGRVLPRGRWVPRWARIRVSFGSPLRFGDHNGMARKEQYREASRRMMAAIAELKASVEDRPGAAAGIAGGSSRNGIFSIRGS
jgi:1-acyl-sn-glycerol-3-phosphate acyltransferase